ncbi:MAG: DUF3822 family protein [Bacteroidetes bacterium]|nr:DUF3822 family protein [Bacteroidota bacterium]
MDQPDAFSPSGRIVDESFDRNFTRNCTLCLLLLPHRLAYAVYDEDRRKFTVNHALYLQSDQEHAQYLSGIRALISADDLLHLPFQSVLVGIGSQPVALVPDAHYNHQAPGVFAALQAPLLPADVLRVDPLPTLGAVLEYSVDAALVEYLENTFVHCRLFHAHTPLLLGLERERPDRGDVAYLFFQRQFFTMTVFRDGSLLYVNSFTFFSGEDFLYYVLLVCDELQLDRELTPFVLLGEVLRESAAFVAAQPYLGNLQFGRRPRGFRYNRAIRELPGQFFYNLFAMQLCAL